MAESIERFGWETGDLEPSEKDETPDPQKLLAEARRLVEETAR